MGYYTNFDLHLADEDQRDALEDRISVAHFGISPFEESCKWYDWEDDLCKVSAEFPGLLFWVDGDGEDSGDQWRAFFLDGKHQVHRALRWSPPSEPDELWWGDE